MSLKQQIRQAFQALAYAHAGEMLPDDQKLEILGARHIAASLAAIESSGGTDYAVEICQRLDAGLILLTPYGEPAPAAADELRTRLAEEHIGLRTVTVDGEWVEGVCRFVREHGNVVLVVLGPRDLEATSTARERSRLPKWALSVPMVIVDGLPPPQPAT